MTFAASLSTMRRHPGRVAATILVLYWAMAVTASVNFCAAGDEPFHIAGGLAYWHYGQDELQPENGNLPKRWMTLPLLVSDVHWPAIHRPIPQSAAGVDVSYLVFHLAGNRPALMLLEARAMIALLGAALGALVWWWARRLWGDAAALLAVALFALSPTMLAQGALATADMAASLAFLVAVTMYWRMLERVTWGRVVVCALALGALFLTKMSCVLVLPMLVGLAAVRILTGGPLPWAMGRRLTIPTRAGRTAGVGAATLAAGLGAWAVVWAAFGFRYPMFGAHIDPFVVLDQPWSALPATDPLTFRAIAIARHFHLLPEAWLYGLASTLASFSIRPAFLNGHFSVHGWFWYFPYAMLVKTPLPLLALVILGTAALVRRRPGGAGARVEAANLWYAASPLAALLVVYWLFALASPINIGQRHILPTYAPMLVLTGGAVTWIRGSRARIPALLVAALTIWLATASWWIRPYYLEYFNELAGGPRHGYRHLVDSNLDWGQDLPALHQWLRKHDPHDQEPVYLAYFGPGDPADWDIHALRLVNVTFSPFPVRVTTHPAGGLYCISATLFQGIYTKTPGPWTASYEALYQDLRRRRARGPLSTQDAVALLHLRFGRLRHYLATRTPDGMAGYSILIYRLTDADVARALNGPLP